ncbi:MULTISPECIES: cytochrome c family protein [unclassified Mesorhizobium]|uniref:c-type cytochrome n=1 Tax=unclassified Mesorhizobium TaxID=325217 RepID=UPI000BB03FA7|nr:MULTISPECIES: cytochrome c family protein [unclassified Mesorhizobium]TGT57471.1 cytochrome c family protein [Mesorhizobium sp. M00.F.Ca.ET.170.01.1.1]AZO11798.1 cytochrome c family protein [Mesorhizobium sp. M3A.F.Ca.ET.080.04.2.1]PBB86305.1 cytochrome C [Mesorhizobium sp. WSM3876]RWB73079.1 MAG: cytochrome c family protein [Mesorhizobium sp.]RWB87164.1 MAG: cytochrome c family protein [Mesorhizobium sp.]
MLRAISSAVIFLLAGGLAAHAGGDAALGKKVFNRCIACHEAATDRDRVGPHLMGVVGRKAGSAESFASHYSQAMKEAGAAGLVWDEANLAEYLKAPKQKVPGNKMGFSGLTSDEDIANVIAYLEADPKP